MVGVPGRSQACQTCRERRIKCGLQRPVCAQCTKKNRRCTYQRNHVFVHHDEGTHKTVYRKTDGSLAQTVGKENLPVTNHQNSNSDSNDTTANPNNAVAIAAPSGETLQLWKSPSLVYNLQQALVATAIDDGKASKSYTLCGLMSRCLEIDTPGPLYSAPLACYAAWRGRQENDPNLINASHRFYVQALQQTQKALSDPVTAREDATLAACNALGLFEALECPDRSIAGFKWHRDACCRLIELRGPEAHQDGIAHTLFVSMRLSGFLEALETVHPTFFSEPQWMTIPFLRRPKTPTDKLVDILSHGPGLLVKAFDLENDVKSLPAEQRLDDRRKLEIILDIGRDLSTVVWELDSFLKDLENDGEGSLYWHSDEPEEESELTFPPSLQFQDLGVASALSLHWAMSSLIWASLRDCYRGCNEAGAGLLFLHVFNARQKELSPALDHCNRYEYLTADGMYRRCVDAARKVCQTTAFCTTTDALQSGPPRVSTALSLMIDVVRRQSGADMEHLYIWATKARRAIGEKWVKLLRYQP